MGDPAGVGPEIILKSLASLQRLIEAGALRLTITGEEGAFAAAARSIGLDRWQTVLRDGKVEFVSCGDASEPHVFGEVREDCGRLAYLAIEKSVEIVSCGMADALVTAPIHKEALNRAGYNFNGHTEILAALTNSRDSFMMLACGDLRVSHVTTHVPLAEVSSLLTRERVSRTVEVSLDMLRSLGIEHPRLALAGFNPHAGEGGMIGREDIEILTPVVKAFRRKGVDISGPESGDTIFVRAAAGQFDCVIANYHDQGHIPVKLLGFRIDQTTGRWTGLSGVNVTLGLPIVRTSVDHGTAFDIAGSNSANPQSMVEAIEYAARMVEARKVSCAATAG